MKLFIYPLLLTCLLQFISMDVHAQVRNKKLISKTDTTLLKTTYTVKRGENLWLIARKLNVSIQDLYKWNTLPKDSKLYPEQKLIIYTKKKALDHTIYTVRSGDYLGAIAQNLKVSIRDLCKWNNITERSILHPDQQLVVYTQTAPSNTQSAESNTESSASSNTQSAESNTESSAPSDTIDDRSTSDSSLLTPHAHNQRILLFGDSMIEGLNIPMQKYAAENDHDVLNIIWYSSSTKTWAKYIDTLTHFMNRFKPTYIIICLGANELFVTDVPKRDAYIKKILAEIGDLPYVWIGPPNWKQDTGINDLIEENVGSERFFISKNLEFKRTSDGVHLTRTSAAVWMDKIAAWLNENATYPLLMNIPQNNKKMRGNSVLLMPKT